MRMEGGRRWDKRNPVPVPKLTVFECIPLASDICNWNPVLELLGTVRNSVSIRAEEQNITLSLNGLRNG